MAVGQGSGSPENGQTAPGARVRLHPGSARTERCESGLQQLPVPPALAAMVREEANWVWTASSASAAPLANAESSSRILGVTDALSKPFEEGTVYVRRSPLMSKTAPMIQTAFHVTEPTAMPIR